MKLSYNIMSISIQKASFTVNQIFLTTFPLGNLKNRFSNFHQRTIFGEMWNNFIDKFRRYLQTSSHPIAYAWHLSKMRIWYFSDHRWSLRLNETDVSRTFNTFSRISAEGFIVSLMNTTKIAPHCVYSLPQEEKHFPMFFWSAVTLKMLIKETTWINKAERNFLVGCSRFPFKREV